jgi:hypothetical protein
MANYVIKKFWEYFSDYSLLFDLVSRSTFKNREKMMIDKNAQFEEAPRIIRIIHFLIKSDLFSVFMDTYANELDYWLTNQLEKRNMEDMNQILCIYKQSIQLENEFWKMMELKEDWKLGEQTIHKIFLIPKRGYSPPLCVQNILPIIKLQDFSLICSGFSSTLNINLLEKEIIIYFSNQIKENQNFDILFEIYLWAQFIGSKLGITDKEVTQRIFEGLEIILDNHFHFFELYIMPVLYKQIIEKGAWNESMDLNNHFPNHFNYLKQEQIMEFGQLKMKELVPTFNDISVGNFKFWFLIKMIYLVSDKTQLFNDFYAYYFERKIREIEK